MIVLQINTTLGIGEGWSTGHNVWRLTEAAHGDGVFFKLQIHVLIHSTQYSSN